MYPLLVRRLATQCDRVQRDAVTRPEGLEPPTVGLEIRCSILLSYERKVLQVNDFVPDPVSSGQPKSAFWVTLGSVDAEITSRLASLLARRTRAIWSSVAAAWYRCVVSTLLCPTV